MATNKEVDTAALTSLMSTLGVDSAAQPAPYLGWIAGSVIGGVVGLALVGTGVWYLVTHARQGGLPVSANAAGTDAGLRLPRVADKYAVGQSQEVASDGGTPTSTAQVYNPITHYASNHWSLMLLLGPLLGCFSTGCLHVESWTGCALHSNALLLWLTVLAPLNSTNQDHHHCLELKHHAAFRASGGRKTPRPIFTFVGKKQLVGLTMLHPTAVPLQVPAPIPEPADPRAGAQLPDRL
jgi:hypothetical protein